MLEEQSSTVKLDLWKICILELARQVPLGTENTCLNINWGYIIELASQKISILYI